MKYYDYNKAKQYIIREKPELAYLGIKEDWENTKICIYRDGKFLVNLDDTSILHGIRGSYIGTPILEAYYHDADGIPNIDYVECWTNNLVSNTPIVQAGVGTRKFL